MLPPDLTFGIEKVRTFSPLSSRNHWLTGILLSYSQDDIPAGLFRQMTTCQTAANEFLRQYWSSTLPQPPELQTAATATPAQRAAKAVKMIGYLSKTPEKVQALVETAKASGLDGARVEVAMRPVLDAVNHALTFHRNKEAAAAGRRGAR